MTSQKDDPYDYIGWFMESRDIAATFVYDGLKTSERPGRSYEEAGLKIAEQRIASAGFRLARLLNEVWRYQ